VTVASSGVLTDLQLDDRVGRLPAAELARVIMTAVARAQAGLVEQVATVVRETVGADSETGRVVLASYERRFPAPSDDSVRSDDPADGRTDSGGRTSRRGW
jgi:hypothetical protein